MEVSTITLRVEKDLKQRFYNLCEDFGLSASSAINIFMKAVVREKKIPFEISSDTEAVKRKHYLELIESMQKKAEETELKDMTLEEINAEIRAARNENGK